MSHYLDGTRCSIFGQAHPGSLVLAFLGLRLDERQHFLIQLFQPGCSSVIWS